MAPILALPNETLERILSFIASPDLAPDSDDEDRRAHYKLLEEKEICHNTLRDTCLVSRRFRDLAQPLLFRDFQDDGDAGDLTKTLKFTKALYRRPELGEYTRNVTLSPYDSGEFKWKVDLSSDDVAFFTPIIKDMNLPVAEEEYCLRAMKQLDVSFFTTLLVNKTPNLRCLVLPAEHFSALPLVSLMKRNPAILSTLQSVWLEVGDARSDRGWSLNNFKELFTLPKLRRTVAEFANLVDSDYPETWTPGSLPAEEAVFLNCHADAKSITKFMKACKNLKAFTFRNFGLNPFLIRDTTGLAHKQFNAKDAVDAALAQKDTLEHFHVDFARMPEDVGTAEDVKRYIRRTVKISSLRPFTAMKSLMIPHAVLPAHPKFPPNIEMLEIHDCNSSVVDMVAEVAAEVKKGRYPNLKIFMCLATDVSRLVKLTGQIVPPGKTPHDMMMSLLDLFKGTQVDFRINPYVLPDFDLYDSDEDESDEDDDGSFPLGGPGGAGGGA
ncbi:hypothetical protein N7470_004805 [Penicillium chermesinum]|nr:hypothetical protein N7470_004805 [Penicillium chermesinum]